VENLLPHFSRLQIPPPNRLALSSIEKINATRLVQKRAGRLFWATELSPVIDVTAIDGKNLRSLLCA
jgi:hypothetical protein